MNIIIKNRGWRTAKYLAKVLFDSESFVFYKKGTKLIDILVKERVFKSKNEARRNNWNRELLIGYQRIKVGRRIFYIISPVHKNLVMDLITPFYLRFLTLINFCSKKIINKGIV